MSAAVASACAAAALRHYTSAATPTNHHYNYENNNSLFMMVPPNLGRYESLKRSDWNRFRQYLSNHDPPLKVTCFGVAHVLGFLNHLAHADTCPSSGFPRAPGPCACLDGVVGRLRAAFDEHAGPHVTNPFGARAVRVYLRDK